MHVTLTEEGLNVVVNYSSCFERGLHMDIQHLAITSGCHNHDSHSVLVYTVKLSYSYSSVRPLNWTTVLVPVYMHRGRINLLSNSAMVGGNTFSKPLPYTRSVASAQNWTNEENSTLMQNVKLFLSKNGTVAVL